MKKMFLFLLLVPMLAMNNPTDNKTTISVEELELYNLIMDYRQSHGLERIPLSNSLTIVAQTHCKDLANNKPDLKAQCNAHSWSANGKWSSCCYTSDHKEAACMWNKPNELTSYQGYGFEIAVGSSDPQFDNYVMTPEYAISSWKGSFHHNNAVSYTHLTLPTIA